MFQMEEMEEEGILVASATALSPAVAAKLPAFATTEAAVATAPCPAVAAIFSALLTMDPTSWAVARRGRKGRR